MSERSPLKKNLLNRRRFLQLAAAEAGVAMVMIPSPALPIIEELFKEAPLRMPDPEYDAEKFRQWFFERSRLFTEALQKKEVKDLLEANVDENYDFAALDTVMRKLIEHWPIAYNEHLKYLPEVDKQMSDWVASGTENDATFPALPVRLHRIISEKAGEGGSLFTMRPVGGNASNVDIAGGEKILTAEHVVTQTSVAYTTSGPHADVAAMSAAEYARSHTGPRPPKSRVRFVTPADLVGKVLTAPGWDDDGKRMDVVTVKAGEEPPIIDERRSKKIYSSGSLPWTRAVAMWFTVHSSRQSNPALLQDGWRHILQYQGHASTKDFVKNTFLPYMKGPMDNANNASRSVMMLSPGETTEKMYAAGMSGAPVRESGDVVAVLRAADNIHLEVGPQTLVYSIGLIDTDIKPALIPPVKKPTPAKQPPSGKSKRR